MFIILNKLFLLKEVVEKEKIKELLEKEEL
jgi:hypothetical protein